MAGKDQAARDVQTNLENLFASSNFQWRGMVPDGNPAAIAKNRLRLALNARFKNGDIMARGGQALLDQLPTAGQACITSLLDAQSVGRRILYGFAFGCPGAAAPGLAFSILSIDPEQEPELQFNIYKDMTAFNMTGEPFGGQFYLGADGELSRLAPIDAPYGTDQLAIGGTRQDVHIWDLPTAYTHFMAMKGFETHLFMGANGGAGASAVFAFTGRTVTAPDLSAIDPPAGFCVWREKLLMGLATGGPLYVRSSGPPPGTWITVAASSGTFGWGIQFTGSGAQAAGSGNGAACSFRDKAYIASGGENVYVYQTTLDPIVPATTGIPAGSITVACCVHRQKLYVLYKTATNQVRVASFDGTTWVGTVVNLTTLFALDFPLSEARNLVSYRQRLYVAGRSFDGIDFVGRLMFSDFGVDPNASDWTTYPTSPTNTATDLSYFVVF